MSGQSISARDLPEAKVRVPHPMENENNTAQGGQAQGGLHNGSNDDDDNEEDELATIFVDHTFNRQKIGEGFI